tara:strand:+ start:1649 stop:2494 length:846 start_codon:yes stop_codon:yes gene_type:complete
MKKKILILGSEGQVGLHLKSYLKSKNYNVMGFDIVEKNNQDLRKFNNKLLISKIKKSDFIYFLAFDVGGSRYLKKYQNTFEFLSNNIRIMENTFTLVKKFKKPFLFASSQMSNMTYSNYGILKNLGEKYSQILDGLVVKFWNVYGIEHDLNKSHVITDFILKGIKKKEINMLTDGQEVRDFLYAEDCCIGLEKIMLKYKEIKRLKKSIDLTSTKYVKIIYVANIIKKLLLKKNIKIKIIPSKLKDSVQLNKKNKADRYLFKFWKPKFSLEEGISRVIDNYI